MKIAYFLKSLPEKSTTFICTEIEFLRKRGDDVYIFPIWDMDSSNVPSSIAELGDYNYRRFSLLYPGWIFAAVLFLFLKPKVVLGLFSEYRKLYGIRFVFKSLEAALVLKTIGIKRIHAHMLSISVTRARIASILVDTPYTFTAHGSDLLLLSPKDSAELLRGAEGVITPTEYNRKKIVEIAGNQAGESVKVIPYGVDTDFFSPHQGGRNKKGVVDIVIVGRLHPVKGHPYLLEALSILKKRGVKFHLTVVGEGEERGNLERLADDLDLVKFVTFAGSLYGRPLRDRLRGSDIFVLSSLSEGLPVSMLEAMSVGLTVVVPEITGITEVIIPQGRGGGRGNGIIFEAKNPEDLAQKLEPAIRDRDLRDRLGRAARETVILKCSHDAAYRKIAEVIEGSAR
ncbi:MAG: glycosyltransferase [Deltaproteobacteria bacterium]|uniref:Glycosyltransferase n=1 Tax=Candidatus Zymogenus saltonus TaxID=2844893 RepID=A0A9D8PNI5_9DELT|nr:glycosyltransferase [Candidatus Zymogenus saltonus]